MQCWEASENVLSRLKIKGKGEEPIFRGLEEERITKNSWLENTTHALVLS